MITNYQAALLLDSVFGRNPSSFTPPATYYWGLSTTAISADGSGVTEPSGGSYARVSVVNDKVNGFTNANGANSVTNAQQVAFPESTSNWGSTAQPIAYVFISDAPMGQAGGHILYYDALASTRIVQSGTQLLFPQGSISISMSNT